MVTPPAAAVAGMEIEVVFDARAAEADPEAEAAAEAEDMVVLWWECGLDL